MTTTTQIPTATAIDPMYSRLFTLLMVWLAGAIVLGQSDLLANDSLAPPLLGSAVALPPLVAWIAWKTSNRVRNFVLQIDLPTLILLHSLRTIGMGFLFLYAFGLLHPIFAFPAAIGDVMAAVGALVIGIAIYKGMKVPVRSVRRWNTFGLIDFGVAVTAGMAMRSHFLGSAELNTDLMGSFPLVIFPTFLVPLMVIVHLAIYAKLNRQQDDQGYVGIDDQR